MSHTKIQEKHNKVEITDQQKKFPKPPLGKQEPQVVSQAEISKRREIKHLLINFLNQKNEEALFSGDVSKLSRDSLSPKTKSHLLYSGSLAAYNSTSKADR